MILLRYFASLREQLDTAEEQIELPPQVVTVHDLTRWLQARNAHWQEAMTNPRLLTARNQALVGGDAPVYDGDEIAWFPPVTGG